MICLLSCDRFTLTALENGQEGQSERREMVKLPLQPFGPKGEVSQTRVVTVEEGAPIVPLLSLKRLPVVCGFAIII